eukprot:349916-Chlamydomonas_euryale.AAC.5
MMILAPMCSLYPHHRISHLYASPFKLRQCFQIQTRAVANARTKAMCNKAPKRTPELQGTDFKAPTTSTTRAEVLPRHGGGREGLRQVTPGFRQFRHLRRTPVTPHLPSDIQYRRIRVRTPTWVIP